MLLYDNKTTAPKSGHRPMRCLEWDSRDDHIAEILDILMPAEILVCCSVGLHCPATGWGRTFHITMP